MSEYPKIISSISYVLIRGGDNIRKNKTGFTLLELLIVVIIIGILASLAIPQYLKVARRSWSAEALSNIGTLVKAEVIYYAEKGELLTGQDFDSLVIEDPNDLPSAKFLYEVYGITPKDMVVIAKGQTGSVTEGLTIIYSAITGEIRIKGLKF